MFSTFGCCFYYFIGSKSFRQVEEDRLINESSMDEISVDDDDEMKMQLRYQILTKRTLVKRKGVGIRLTNQNSF